MAKKHEVYWYKTNPAVAAAFLCHCRDRDLRAGPGIPAGSIVQGIEGFAIAEADVPGLTGSVITAFRPNRQCEWAGFTLRCMAHPQIPEGATKKQQLRDYNYILGELTDPAAINQAKLLGVPVVQHSDGSHLINLEISVFQRQGPKNSRRAKLL